MWHLLRRIFNTFSKIVLSCLLVSNSAFATDDVFVVGPSTLRTQLLANNITVLEGLNSLYAAKIQVNAARAALLPSLNLGFGGQVTDVSSFALANVTFLLPFLLPSNWFELKKSIKLLSAEGQAFYALELNTYASAEALYLTVLSDYRLLQVVKKQSENYTQIKDLLELRQKNLGNVNPADLLQAQAQAAMGLNQVSQLQSLLNQEKAALRKALSLPLSTDIQFIQANVSGPDLSQFESTQKLIDRSLEISPEKKQLDHLIDAAKAEKWSLIFGFLSGGTLSAEVSKEAGAGKSIAFDKSTLGYKVGFGFGMFPAVHLGQNTLDQLQLRMQELQQEQTFTVEATLGLAKETENQLNLSQFAESKFRQGYEIEVQRYNLGMSSYITVLSAQNSWANAALTALQAQVALDKVNVTLNRLLITDQFAEIKNCDLDKKSKELGEKNFFKWFKEILSKTASDKAIDKVCRN